MEELLERLKAIEAHFGGPGAAAKAAGVTGTSWSRWKAGKPAPVGRSAWIIERLYEEALREGRGQ